MPIRRPVIVTPMACRLLRLIVTASGADELQRRDLARPADVIDIDEPHVEDAVASIHHLMSLPRYMRGTRTCSPVAR